MTLQSRVRDASSVMKRLVKSIQLAIVGKEEVMRNLVLALAVGRHVLVEDVPGVGKTTLIKALARSIDLSFRRIQFTPDLLPSDITGTSVLNPEDSSFSFRSGPVFHNIILADEINRASPKTQSALLECMEEGQVTVDGVSYPLPRPFLVMATQNPIEYEGTFPLPEAQLDRFSLSLKMGYPAAEEEREMLGRLQNRDALDDLQPVVEVEEVTALRPAAEEVFASESLMEYIIDIARATRDDDDIYLGASPRASLMLLKLSQALALYREMDYVLPDHVKEMAPAVLRHRLILTPEARWENRPAETVIARILRHTPVPGMEQVSPRRS
ncbi:MAG: MoxR family ATPase [Bacillota bacterium]